MKVAILCGGLGTRFREETELRPKPMVEVGDQPCQQPAQAPLLGLGLVGELRHAGREEC